MSRNEILYMDKKGMQEMEQVEVLGWWSTFVLYV